MSISYREADGEVYGLLEEVIREYFPDYAILDPKPRIAILMAHSDKVPCLKLHGSPCRAVIKIVKAEERANGGPDVRILLDAFLWAGSKERRRRALLAHELAHLTLKVSPSETAHMLNCERDDYDRPAFGTQPADWQAEGFRQVVEWFGDDAYEKIELDRIINGLGQEVFGFVKADPLLKRIEEVEASVTQEAVEAIEALMAEAEANGQPVVADAVTADHEEDDPDWHGEPVGWTQEQIDEHDEMHRRHPVVGSEIDDAHDHDGWDVMPCHPLSDEAEADALAAIEAGGKKAKGRKRSKANPS